ncbi:unnamed protein product, partial [Brassica rapa]
MMTKKLSGGITYQELKCLADPMRKEIALVRKEIDSIQALMFVGTGRVLICLLGTGNQTFAERENSFQVITYCQIVVSTCAFGGGDNLYQPIGMSKASTQKVCYVTFWDDVTHATQEAEGHKIGENSLLIKSWIISKVSLKQKQHFISHYSK